MWAGFSTFPILYIYKKMLTIFKKARALQMTGRVYWVRRSSSDGWF
jgi:hypothetical protein